MTILDEVCILLCLKYPVEIDKYRKDVGAVRVLNVKDILGGYFFLVIVEAVENSDVDIWVYDEEKGLVLVIEVTNWRKSSYMSMKKAISTRDNFRKYSCEKLFVCSFELNYIHKIEYFDPDVEIMILGFQTQLWYDWFRDRGLEEGMVPDNEVTQAIVKWRIEEFLSEKGLI